MTLRTIVAKTTSYLATAAFSLILGAGLMYLASQDQVNKEKSVRRELARICGDGLDASQGINRSCEEAYKELTICIDENSCRPERLSQLNQEKKTYEQRLKIASEEMTDLVGKFNSRQ